MDAVEPILRQVLLTGEPVTNVPLALHLPTRPEVGHWVVHYFPMNDASGRVTRIGVVVVEVTEQKNWKTSSATWRASWKKRKTGCECCSRSTILNSSSDCSTHSPIFRRRFARSWSTTGPTCRWSMSPLN